MNDRKLRVGIVGLRRGRGLVNALSTHPRLEIAAVCDLDSAVLRRLGDDFNVGTPMQFTNYDEMVASDVDVIVIATPIKLHMEQSVKALDAGKHVLSEQTQASTVAECQAIVDAEKRSGRVYMMAENYTYFHYVQQWRERINQGELGEITYAEADFIHEITGALVDPVTKKRQWRYNRSPIEYTAHSLGPILTWLDDRIVRVTGMSSGKKIYPVEEGEGFVDMEVALFQTQKGRLIKVVASQVAPRYHDLVWFGIHGTKGFIENGREGGWGATKGLLFSKDSMIPTDGAVEIMCDPFDPNAPAEAASGGYGTSEYVMIRDFVDAIESGTRAPIDSVRASDLTIPGIIAHESAQQGGAWLDVPLLS